MAGMAGFVKIHPPLTTIATATVTPIPAIVATRPLTVPTNVVTATLTPPVLVPIAVRKSMYVATVNPAILLFQNPLLGGFHRPSQGSPRGAFALPVLISPTVTPTDQTLFEEPLDGTKKHYLPLFGVGTTSGGSGSVKWVSFEPSGQQFQMTVHLADVTDPSVTASNIRQDATARYLLTANLQGRVMNWDLSPSLPDGAALKLTLTIPPLSGGAPDLNGRDDLYHAMTEPDAQAKLIVRRTLTLALASSTGTGGETLYGQQDIAIDSMIPFTFDKDLDSNVFAQIQNVGADLSPWVKHEVNWKGRSYVYYQNRSHPDQIYFLPDAFKVVRQPEAPHAPSLIVSTNGDDIDTVAITLSYLASPVWDPQRIEAAGAELQQQLPLAGPPTLALFEASETKLSLKLPSDDPSQPRVLQAQPDVIIDIANGIQGSITLKLPQFLQVYDALFDNVSDLLTGQIEVKVNTDVNKIQFIARASDFTGDIFDIKTTIDSQSNRVVVLQNSIESPIHIDALTGFLTKSDNTILNCVEEISPSLPVDLLAAGSGTVATPGGSVTVTLHPAPGQQVDSSIPVLFDFGQTRVLPDPAAIWHAIAQNQVVGPVSRKINVKLLASVLSPAGTTAPSPDAILAVQVEFKNGQTASFDSSQVAAGAVFLSKQISLALPVENYVLKTGGNDTYLYRVTLITGSGNKVGNFVSDNKDEVFVSVN
jgi:hypothetical protein